MIEEEKKKAEFHAQPMPIFDGVKGLPAKKPPTPTKVQPFNLRSDVRGTARQEVLQREVQFGGMILLHRFSLTSFFFHSSTSKFNKIERINE